MAKKRSAKLIMQQRKNFADAKDKLVGNVKDLASDEKPEAMPPNVASRFTTHLKSLLAADGKVSTALGMAPSQNENRPMHFETGATEHLPDNVVSFADFMERKKNIGE